MKKLLCLFIILHSYLFAEQYPKEIYWINVEFGHRTDNMLWNIGNVDYVSGGTTYHPDILSELAWKDIQSYYGKIELYGESGDYRLKINYARTLSSYSGDNQDSDYYYNGRTGEFSRSNNKTDGSYFEDYGIHIGDSYNLGERSSLIVWLGYEVSKQYLKINNGSQTIGGPLDLSGLNSTYDSELKGIKTGLEYIMKMGSFGVKTNVNYHFLKYEAKANWNLRTDLAHPVSFEHVSNEARGLSYGLDVLYSFNEKISGYISYRKKEIIVKNGQSISYSSSGTRGVSSLNEVKWNSENIAFGISYLFK